MNDYRADIDGLRAYAVIPVVFFHLGLPFFAGGFVGVDVFFVISGYVITAAILRAQERGIFSFSAFFMARLRRLYPAMLVVVAFSLLASSLLFSPEDLSNFGLSALTTLSGISNFHFWRTLGDYWSNSKWTTPLLHTWSLAVEAQFYVFWPILLVFTPRHLLLAAIVAVATVSLILAEIILRYDPQAVFYLMPFRVVEFAIGGALVLVGEAKRHSDAILAFGLLLLSAALVFTSESVFPGIVALPACMGAALCIHAGRAPMLGILLDNPVTVWLGKVSYSIYLVHWPIIIFWRYFTYHPPDFLDQLALIALTVILGGLSYYCIERPFRYAKQLSAKAFVSVCIALAVTICAPAISSMRSGWEWRVTYVMDDDSRHYGGAGCLYPFCSSTSVSGKEIALTGDSHARMYFAGFDANFDGKRPFSVWHFDARCRFVNDPEDNGLPDYNCDERLGKYLDYIQTRQIETVVLAYRWSKVANKIPLRDRARAIAQRTRDWLNHPKMRSVTNLVLVLQTPQMDEGQTPAACLRVPSFIKVRDCTAVNIDNFRAERELNRKILDAMRRELPERVKIQIANPFKVLCDQTQCLRMKGSAVLYSDEHHLSKHGSRLVVSELIRPLLQP
jgi:peptidoglycan/LPS O-acetylase OafA/YrhL